MRNTLLVCLPLLFAGCSTPIFNGRDLEGWVIERNGQFSVRDGLLFVNKGTGWLRSDGEYGDFILRLDFRFLEPKANSGIFVRTGPTSHDDENGWPDNGYQVQCMDSLEGQRHLASMIAYGGPGFTDKDYESDLQKVIEACHKQGEWNTYEIECIGENLTVKLNGVLVTKAWNIKNLRGHVGIQAEHGLLEFRNVRVKEIE